MPCKVSPTWYLSVAGEIGRRLALLDEFFVDQIHPLPGPLDQPAVGEDFGDPPIAGVLPVDDVLDGDSQRQTAGAVDFQPAGELPKENAAAELIVSVADAVQDASRTGRSLNVEIGVTNSPS